MPRHRHTVACAVVTVCFAVGTVKLITAQEPVHEPVYPEVPSDTLILLPESAVYPQLPWVLPQLANSGKAALEAGRFDEARERFQEGLEVARGIGDADAAGRFSFLLGRAYQEKATVAPAPAESQGLLRSAAEHYRRALQEKQDSGPILNNLARVYTQLGMTRQAAELYQLAIRLEDEHQPVYLLNLAELLAATGDSIGATKTYRELVERLPESSEAHAFLVNFYLQRRSDELPPYLWAILERGEILRAQETALRALEQPGFNESTREQLLTVLASALAEKSYDPSEFLDSETGRRLQALSADPEIGRGARALRDLHVGLEWSADASWWFDRGAPDQDHDHGMWPPDAFRKLGRSIAQWHARNGDYPLAERYLEMVAKAVPGEVDPRALGDLARVYLKQGDLARVEQMANQYESQLFGGKLAAYRTSQLEDIYEYHRTLGEMYAILERWGDPHTVTSAIFQLEHARQAAESLDAKAEPSPRTELRFGPEQANLLSRAYLATGDTTASVRTRIVAAERYEKAGKVSEAKILPPVDVVPQSEIEGPYPQQDIQKLQEHIQPDSIQMPPEPVQPGLDQVPQSEIEGPYLPQYIQMIPEHIQPDSIQMLPEPVQPDSVQ